MAHTYIVNKNSYIIRNNDNGKVANHLGVNVELPDDLGDLFLHQGDFQCYKYKYVGNTVMEQQIKPYAMMNENNDIIATFLSGNLDNPDDAVEITQIELDSLTALYDDKYRLPLYQYIANEVVAKANIFDEVEKCEKAFAVVHKQMEHQIARQYSLGKEAKISKAYLDWIKEGQPPSDPRESSYTDMQTAIADAKARFTPEKATIQTQLDILQPPL